MSEEGNRSLPATLTSCGCSSRDATLEWRAMVRGSDPSPARRPLSADTSPEAEALQFEHYRTLEPWQKVRIMCELGTLMETVARRGIRERHTTAGEHEIRLRLAALRLGPELVQRVWGWDPEVEGW